LWLGFFGAEEADTMGKHKPEVELFDVLLTQEKFPRARLANMSVGATAMAAFCGVLLCVPLLLMVGLIFALPSVNSVRAALLVGGLLVFFNIYFKYVWKAAWRGATRRWVNEQAENLRPGGWWYDGALHGISIIDDTLGASLTTLTQRRQSLLNRCKDAVATPPPGWHNPWLGDDSRTFLQGAYLQGRLLPLAEDIRLWKADMAAFVQQLEAAKLRLNGVPSLREAYETKAVARE
jgi:hypothetical protein